MKARVRDIVTIASRLSGVPRERIIGPRRDRATIHVRACVYAVAREHGHSFPQIGHVVGGRDHSTVIHSLDSLDIYFRCDPKLPTLLDDIRLAAADAEPFLALPAPPTEPVAEPKPDPAPKAQAIAKPILMVPDQDEPPKPKVAPQRISTDELIEFRDRDHRRVMKLGSMKFAAALNAARAA